MIGNGNGGRAVVYLAILAALGGSGFSFFSATDRTRENRYMIEGLREDFREFKTDSEQNRREAKSERGEIRSDIKELLRRD